jgi:hypothetical protein
MAKKPTQMEIAVENARRVKAVAEAERARLDAEAAEAEEFLRLYEKFAPKAEIEAANEAAAAAKPAASGNGAKFSSTPEIQQAARAYLQKLGQPASIRQIYETLVFEGIRIPGQNPIMNLSSKLSTSKDMEFTKDVGWWFRGQHPSPDRGAL